jgi:hypothetical protein
MIEGESHSTKHKSNTPQSVKDRAWLSWDWSAERAGEREKLTWQLLVSIPGHWNLSWKVRMMLLKWLIMKGCNLQTSTLYITICTKFYRATRWHNWLRHCAASWKVTGSIPGGVIGIFQWHSPYGRTMALGLTQPLTEMSTRNVSLGVKAAGAWSW